MDLLQLMQERYSCRKFKPQPVAEDVLGAILEVGRLAPTARDQQPQRVYAVTGGALAKIDACTQCRFGAPAALLITYDGAACWRRARYDDAPSGEVDAAIVTTHMMLEAAARGVGSLWVMHFDPAAARREFALPKAEIPVAMLMLGYPAEDAAPAPAHTERKPMGSLVHFLR